MQQQEPKKWHSMECDAVLAELETDPAGLSGSEAARRLQEYGENILLRSRGDNHG